MKKTRFDVFFLSNVRSNCLLGLPLVVSNGCHTEEFGVSVLVDCGGGDHVFDVQQRRSGPATASVASAVTPVVFIDDVSAPAFSVLAERSTGKRISKMTHFVPNGTLDLNAINQLTLV